MRPQAVDTMSMDIDNIRKEFFKKSISVGYHNIRYAWSEIAATITEQAWKRQAIEAVPIEEGKPSADTVRNRLDLKAGWDDFFHEALYGCFKVVVRCYPCLRWSILIDETYDGYYGKYLKELLETPEGEDIMAHLLGHKPETKKGSTGSFGFLVVMVRSKKILLPIAIFPIRKKMRYEPLLEPLLKRMRQMLPYAPILADRGFGQRVAFFRMLERVGGPYCIRFKNHGKSIKQKVENGVRQFSYWYGKGDAKVLLTLRVGKDRKGNLYLFATTFTEKDRKWAWLRQLYKGRWGIENMFKFCDRIHLPTSSIKPRMRLFCQMLAHLLFALWQLQRLLTPRIRLALQRFVHWCVKALRTIAAALQGERFLATPG